MKERAILWYFWYRCFQMWWQWIKPTSPFIASISLIAMIIGGLGKLFGVFEVASSVLFWSGLSVSLIMLIVIAPYKVWKQDMEALQKRINELTPLNEFKENQIGNEGQWLYLVMEDMRLLPLKEAPDQLVVQFHIDSGLLYDIRPTRILISPLLGGYEPLKWQDEISTPPILERGKRTSFGCRRLKITDNGLLKRMESVRAGSQMLRELKISIETQKANFELRSSFGQTNT